MEKELTKIHEFVNSLEKEELCADQESLLFVGEDSMYGEGSNKISCGNSTNSTGTCKNTGDCTSTQNSSVCNNTGVCSNSNNSSICTGGSTGGSTGGNTGGGGTGGAASAGASMIGFMGFPGF